MDLRPSVYNANLYFVLSSYPFLIASVPACLLSAFSFSTSSTVFLNRPAGTGCAFTSRGNSYGLGITFGFGLVRLNGFASVTLLLAISPSLGPLIADILPVCPAAPVAWLWVSLKLLLLSLDSLRVVVILPVAFFSTWRRISLTFGKFFSMPPMILSSRY